MRARFAVCMVLALPACNADGPSSVATRPPDVGAAVVAPNPHNVLSAVLTAQVSYADSVAVEYASAGGALEMTPAVLPERGTATIPVLGLRAASPYALRVVAFGASVTYGEPLQFTTGALPDDLPVFVAGGTDPSPGFVAIAAGRYGIVMDNSGRVVWYRYFADGLGLNFQPLPNGHYGARPPSSHLRWVELDPLGEITRTIACAGGRTPRFHDALVQPDGAWWLMCDETRTMDLTAAGGSADAQVTGTVVQKLGADGTLQFQWSAFDDFAIEDLPLAERTGPLVNWTHGNAIDLDLDGNLLVSFRALNEVTKIDTRTGAVLWRMGGSANQFTFLGTSLPAFAGQHSVRVTGPGRLLLLDNVGDPQESRAERFVIDEVRRTARLEQALASAPPVTALLGGTAQHLPGGRTLVSFGNAGRVEEYDPDGQVVWRLENPGYVFRAQRIASLYAPGVRAAGQTIQP